MALAPGTRLDSYEILSLIGAGGMGEVYRARDTRLERDVAVKVLPVGVAADPDRLKRFEQEARATAALNHPNILHGLRHRQRRRRRPTSSPSCWRVRRCAARSSGARCRRARPSSCGVAAGATVSPPRTSSGIVHRDLKPDNIFITARRAR